MLAAMGRLTALLRAAIRAIALVAAPVAAGAAPFPVDRPPPIVTVEIKTADLDDILAYVAPLAPVDLGGALQHQ